MDNRLIQAVAGAGKTSHIINSLRSSGRSAVVTYTINNYNNLRERIAEEYGCIPSRIRLYTYFSFLYSFCLRPFLGDDLRLKGINWSDPPDFTRQIARTDNRHYLDSNHRLYYSRMAGLLVKRNVVPDTMRRLAKYFDSLFVDEIQDFAGHDFNFICALGTTDMHTLLVGDFYQHTYDTSRDGNINKNLHKHFSTYMSKITELGIDVDATSLSKSHRCSPSVCQFVRDNLGVEIESHRNDKTTVEYVNCAEKAAQIFHDANVVKLMYELHHRYPCFSNNWGASKGIDSYGNVCVVLNNKTDKLYRSGQLKQLSPTTRNKLYVACTRARGALYFVPEKYYHPHRAQSG